MDKNEKNLVYFVFFKSEGGSLLYSKNEYFTPKTIQCIQAVVHLKQIEPDCWAQANH